ncbi:MAG: hypothetical protein ACI4DQ_07410 [Lachnospiraceae bacterium]
MKWLQEAYRKHEKILCNLVFPLILFIYPLVTLNQGIDVSDSTYSLSNFLYFPRMEGMWVISTYVANVCGWLLTHLPFGTTLLGMRLYTGFLVSATVLLVYYQLRRWMPAWIVYTGELIAIGFLWIPVTILYNYLTYFFFVLGTVLLYRGLVENKNSNLFSAGLALGFNLLVRIPNLTQTALIIGLWYYLAARKKGLSVIVQKTGYCLAGYLAGVALPLLAVLLQYGVQGLVEAIRGLGAVAGADASYTPLSMVLAVFKAYAKSGEWFLLLGIAVSLGMAMFALRKGRLEKIKRLIYLAGMAVLLRFLWGRGMFSFRYYEDYSSMYEWGMLGLFLGWIAAIYMLASIRPSPEEKLWAVLVLVILAITPLGSNNYTYQNLNNLFLVAPFTLYTFVKIFRYRQGDGPLSGLSFPWKAMVAATGAMIFIQSTGFHLGFSFRDGMDGTPRDCLLTSPRVVAGMKTTQENGEALAGLFSYWQERQLEGKTVVLFGDCPGLSYLLNMPFALGTAWPDLDSFSYEAFAEELEGTKEGAVVIIRNKEPGSEVARKKKACLFQWMEKEGYACGYDSNSYSVYLKENGQEAAGVAGGKND